MDQILQVRKVREIQNIRIVILAPISNLHFPFQGSKHGDVWALLRMSLAKCTYGCGGYLCLNVISKSDTQRFVILYRRQKQEKKLYIA